MHHSHTLPVPTRSRISRLVPLVVAILAAATIVVVLVQVSDDEPASFTKTPGAVSGSPATVSRPDESGVAAAITARPESGPSESTVGAALAGQRRLESAAEGAVTRRWQAYDEAIRSLSQTKGGEPTKSLSQIKRDAAYLRGH
jgi:hypothetical protein